MSDPCLGPGLAAALGALQGVAEYCRSPPRGTCAGRAVVRRRPGGRGSQLQHRRPRREPDGGAAVLPRGQSRALLRASGAAAPGSRSSVIRPAAPPPSRWRWPGISATLAALAAARARPRRARRGAQPRRPANQHRARLSCSRLRMRFRHHAAGAGADRHLRGRRPRPRGSTHYIAAGFLLSRLLLAFSHSRTNTWCSRRRARGRPW